MIYSRWFDFSVSPSVQTLTNPLAPSLHCITSRSLFSSSTYGSAREPSTFNMEVMLDRYALFSPPYIISLHAYTHIIILLNCVLVGVLPYNVFVYSYFLVLTCSLFQVTDSALFHLSFSLFSHLYFIIFLSIFLCLSSASYISSYCSKTSLYYSLCSSISYIP